MICKIIEDNYTFEQIESIDEIDYLNKKFNLNISAEDKMYPLFYEEIGIQTSYKIYKDNKLIAFSGFHFYVYDIAELTPFDIVKICKFKIKYFPKQYYSNLNLLKFGEVASVWYLIYNQYNLAFSMKIKNFLDEEIFDDIFLSQEFNKKNYKDLVKLLKYIKEVNSYFVELMYKYVRVKDFHVSSYGRCEKLLCKYTNYFDNIDANFRKITQGKQMKIALIVTTEFKE